MGNLKLIFILLLGLVTGFMIAYQQFGEQWIPSPIDKQGVYLAKKDSAQTLVSHQQMAIKDSLLLQLEFKMASIRMNVALLKAMANQNKMHNDSLRVKLQLKSSVNKQADYKLTKNKTIDNKSLEVENLNGKPAEQEDSELLEGLELELKVKDRLIDSLELGWENNDQALRVLNQELAIQKGVVESKEMLIDNLKLCIAQSNKKQERLMLWDNLKLKGAVALILLETVALMVK